MFRGVDWISFLARRFRQSRDGAVAIQVAILAVVLIGASALAVEIGFVYYKQRQMQAVADAAATGGAVALSDPTPDPVGEARSIAGRLNFVNGVDGVAVTVNHPPLHGALVGDTSAVEVIVQQPQRLAMANLVTGTYGGGPHVWTVSATAVASANRAGSSCIIALDSGVCTSTPAITIRNNAIIQPPPCGQHCGIAVNSSCNNALVVYENAEINAPVWVNGRWQLMSNAKLNCTPKTQGAPRVPDPYAGVVFSTAGLVTRTQPGNCSTCDLLPGYYPVGLSYSNRQTLNLAPGTYYIGTKLILQNNVTVNATGGVTLVIDGNYAISIGNNARLNVTAPTSGATKGIAIASIRTASPTVTQTFSNNAILNVDGAIYFPNQTAYFSNNAIINLTACNQLIAKRIDYQNNATLSDTGCPSVGGTPVAGGSGVVQLME